ncbi:MAG: hypothetical protein R6U50_06545 [Desulfobacterales bacterium]
MKPEQIYMELKDLAEKLGITVSEQNLRKTGIHVGSGLCKIKGKNVFIMDKHESIHGKIDILANCLGDMPTEDIYIVPAVRDVLSPASFRRKAGRRERSEHDQG